MPSKSAKKSKAKLDDVFNVEQPSYDASGHMLPFHFSVRRCNRCGKTHKSLLAKPIKGKRMFVEYGNSNVWAFAYAMCPNDGGPVLVYYA